MASNFGFCFKFAYLSTLCHLCCFLSPKRDKSIYSVKDNRMTPLNICWILDLLAIHWCINVTYGYDTLRSIAMKTLT